MKVTLATSPHLNHAAVQEGILPLGGGSGLAQTFVPMGLLSVAGAMPKTATVSIADVNKAINSGVLPLSGEFYRAAADMLVSTDPGVIGFMTEADSFHHVLRICQSIREQSPGTVLVLGGPHASAVAHETIEHFKDVDFIVAGEGELAFGQLLECLESGRAPDGGNLIFRRRGHVVNTPTLPLIADLDLLPMPDYSLIEINEDDGIFVEVGRGCPFRCNFCFTAPYWQRKHRIKSPSRIVSELRQLIALTGRTDFNFTHDLFTTKRLWVIDFCRELIASGVGVTWTCSSRTDTLDEEQIDWMARAGCRNIYFGVETGTREMQASIDKNLDLCQARAVIQATADAGIGITAGFIAGLPGESVASLRGTLSECFHYLKLPGSLVHLFGFNPYRGSSNYESVKDNLVFDPNFVDFPLGEPTHMANCGTMRAHLGIFSRYCWPSTYDGVDLGIIRAAEEFFPIVNALRELMLAVMQRGVDPLGLLQDWATWVSAEDRADGRLSGGRYSGTIAHFLEFLGGQLARAFPEDQVLAEQVRWECMKNRLRTTTGPLPLDTGALYGEDLIRANSSAARAHFYYAPDFVPDAPRASQEYVFYCKVSGAGCIASVQGLAGMALDLARIEVPRSSVISALTANAIDARAAIEIARATLDALEGSDLLLGTRPSGGRNLGPGAVESTAFTRHKLST